MVAGRRSGLSACGTHLDGSNPGPWGPGRGESLVLYAHRFAAVVVRAGPAVRCDGEWSVVPLGNLRSGLKGSHTGGRTEAVAQAEPVPHSGLDGAQGCVE